MKSAHANAAEVLRMLAASRKPELLSTLTDEAIRFILKLAAEACENLDAAREERDSAVVYAGELRSLLDQVAILLDSQPSPVEGGRWELYSLAEEVRRARAAEQPGAWLRLQDERWAARCCIRAATAVVVAVRERDTARLRACIEVFEEANQAYEGFSS